MRIVAIVSAVLIMATISANAQTPSWVWARSAGGTFVEEGKGVAVDADGNVYVAGWFRSPSIAFGDLSLTKSDSTSSRMFLVKYDSAGVPIWAKTAQAGTSSGYGVATDASGNVYVAGYFYGDTITFDTITLVLPKNDIPQAVFLVKYSSAGTVLWAKSGFCPSPLSCTLSSVAADASGNVCIAGAYVGGITFEPYYLNQTGSWGDIFLVKYDNLGNVLWATRPERSVGGNGSQANSVTTDQNNNVFLTGVFADSTITFGATELVNPENWTSGDVFLAKYDAGGKVLWARSAHSASTEAAYCAATDGDGNAYVTGSFEGSLLNFGPHAVANHGIYSDMFLAKYDGSGNVVWAKGIGSGSYDCGNGVATDAAHSVYITGTCNGSDLVVDDDTIHTPGGDIAVVAKFDARGDLQWATTPLNMNGQSSGHSIDLDTKGNVLVTGYFHDSVGFGVDTLHSQSLLWSDVFVAKLRQAANVSVGEALQSIPLAFSLCQNYPNPFNPSTTIEYSIPQPSFVTLKILDLLGREVAALVNEQKKAGPHSAAFDAPQLASGVYFYTMQAGQFRETKRMVLMK